MPWIPIFFWKMQRKLYASELFFFFPLSSHIKVFLHFHKKMPFSFQRKSEKRKKTLFTADLILFFLIDPLKVFFLLFIFLKENGIVGVKTLATDRRSVHQDEASVIFPPTIVSLTSMMSASSASSWHFFEKSRSSLGQGNPGKHWVNRWLRACAEALSSAQPRVGPHLMPDLTVACFPGFIFIKEK